MEQTDCPKWLKDMPKTDLHCHLGGSIRPKTILELADLCNVDLGVKSEDELKQKIIYKNHINRSLASYLQAIKICESVLLKEEALERAAYEVCEQAHNENVKILELRFGPTNYIKKPSNLKLYQAMESVLSGLKRASRDFDMYTGLIVCGIRTDMAATKLAVELAVNYQDQGVVGFDLAGKENGFRPKDFENILIPVLHNFLPVTIHAGEDDTVASIAEALVYLNARRIGHGITLRESTKLMEYVNKTRTGIEACITSNVDTGAVASVATHPMRAYLIHDDIRVFPNTDNRTISDTTLTKELLITIQNYGFTQKEIFQLGKNGIKAAFLPTQISKKLLEDFDVYISECKKEK
jgi:adenosine deaminase